MNADAVFHWLMRTSLEASMLILAVLGLRLMLGTRLSPAWRMGLWILVGMKLMLPAFIPAGFGIGAWMNAAGPQAVITERMADEWGQTNGFLSDPSVTNDSISHLPATIRLAESAPSALPLRDVALAIWLLGVLAVLSIAFYRQHRFHGFLRRRPQATAPFLREMVAGLSRQAGLHRQVSMVLMPAGSTPAVVGIRQPTLLLPQDWETRFDERSLRHVVLHELLHVRQHDLAWNWAATAVQALHWFNPLVWFVVSRFQADRELRCDAGALAILAPSERLDYGRTLLRIQESFFAPPAIAGLAPCVRNHPTLRQRIHMIAHPTTRQPWVHALLVLTLGVLVCYSFSTARAAEKEVPAKVREGAARSPESGQPRQGEREDGKPMRDGERERDGVRKTGDRDGDGEREPGTRDGEKPRTGARDGEGERKSGMRDGEKPRAGERDGDRPREGVRDGERKPGDRDGEGAARSREGDGAFKKRRGEGDSAMPASSGEIITLHVTSGGDAVVIGEEKFAMNRLRGHLSQFLPQHPGARVLVTGDADVPLGALHNTMDAVRDNGNKNVGIKAE